MVCAVRTIKIIGNADTKIINCQLHSRDRECLSHSADGAFLQPRYLRLRNAERTCHLHLGLSVIKTQGKDLLFPASQTGKRVAQRDESKGMRWFAM